LFEKEPVLALVWVEAKACSWKAEKPDDKKIWQAKEATNIEFQPMWLFKSKDFKQTSQMNQESTLDYVLCRFQGWRTAWQQ
jgi:hypothetical protein